ncbi:MAG: hypothetical protein HQL31_07220, partial [Planctomycetes bacterium]|nr:hypothetical protein [Planctomycetota bacterium]
GFIEHLVKEKHALDMDKDSLAVYEGKNSDHYWCGIREAQLRVSQEDSLVGMAVTLDLGERFDIHPPRKLPVAQRLLLQARKLAYGDGEVAADSPMPTDFSREAQAFVISFVGAKGGLKGGDDLASFEIRDSA